MKLRFHARREHRCKSRPGHPGTHGAANQYVGITWDAANKREVPTAEPFAVDPERSETSKALADSLLKKMRSKNGRKDPPLWPADEATARECGRPFVELKKDKDGWHVPVKPMAIDKKTRLLVPVAAGRAPASGPTGNQKAD